MPETPLGVLQRVFGYNSFRGRQEEVINHLLAGRDALLLMPTGSGKSLCYQIPAIIRPGLAVVVSPLIALMQDQVGRLQSLGVRAAYLNSMLTNSEAWVVKRQMFSDELDLLYVSPERAMMPGFLRALEQLPLALFAIDEAHCVSQWGHDFRPEYLELQILKERFSGVPRLALTATADLHTREDIAKRLQIPRENVFTTSFDRPNLYYQVVPKINWKRQLIGFIRSQPPNSSGIVYRLTRKSVEETAGFLMEQGYKAIAYHAGLEDDIRRANQERFLRESGTVVVATIAFGMGIDKPDVRFVAHLDMPKTLEDYHQQTGRAGRDGLPATVWMTYGRGDATLLSKFLEESEAEPEFQHLERKRLNDMIRFCETRECRRRLLLRHFGEDRPEPCGNCDNCGLGVADWDATIHVEKALLCMVETHQRFGAAYLTDILTGKRSRKITQNGHTRLHSFGNGASLCAEQWRSIFSQMIGEELVTVDTRSYNTLKLNANSGEVLNNRVRVLLRREIPDEPAATRLKRARRERPLWSPDPQEAARDFDRRLFEKLRQCRTELAQEVEVPAFMVFSDAVLRELAARRPVTLSEFLEIKGIGETKADRYGDIFLRIIREHED